MVPVVHNCTFCNIAGRKMPASIKYEDDWVLGFENILRWTPIMLLIIPKNHMTQAQMWSSESISKVGSVAVTLGADLCPHGFRILSNLGDHALQTQEHAHLHLIGGIPLGPYI